MLVLRTVENKPYLVLRIGKKKQKDYCRAKVEQEQYLN